MSVTLNPQAGQISSLRSFQFAKTEKKDARITEQSQDQRAVKPLRAPA